MGFIGFYRILSELGVSKSLNYNGSFIGGFIGPYKDISPIKLKDSSEGERVNSLSPFTVEKAFKHEG